MDEGTRLLRREAERVSPPGDPLSRIMERLALRRRRRRLGTATLALVIAAAGFLVAYAAFEGRALRPASEPRGVARVTATIDVEGLPRGVAAGEGRVWVVGHLMTWPDGTTWPDETVESPGAEFIEVEGDPSEDAILQAIDPASNKVVLRVSMREQLGRNVSPGMLTVGDGAVWLSDRGGWIHKIDPATGEVVGSFQALDRPISVLRAAAGYLWYVAEGDPRVDREPKWEAVLVKVDPGSLEAVATTPIGPCCAADLAEAGGSVWLGHQVIRNSQFDLEVLRIDPGTGEVFQRVPLERGEWTPGDTLLGYMATSPASVWMPRPEAGYIDGIDAGTGEVTTRIPIDAFPLPDGATWHDGYVWLGSLVGGRLARIDPDTQAVTVESLDVPAIANNRAGSDEALWVADSDLGSILRIEVVSGPIPGPSPS